jgi:hypothetical protein
MLSLIRLIVLTRLSIEVIRCGKNSLALPPLTAPTESTVFKLLKVKDRLSNSYMRIKFDVCLSVHRR